MGQQQLLLIVLGVIIVGIAIVVGINLFLSSSVEANKDALVADNMNLAALAQQYYKKPSALAGGNGTFTGFEIPSDLSSTPNGTYTATIAAQSVTLTATGNVQDSDGKVYQVLTTVSPNSINTAIPTMVAP
jgi:type II secretory pathway pseudopilin PulG